MTDTTIVRLWPLPKAFQLFFIIVMVIVIGIAISSQLSLLLNDSYGCHGDYNCSHATTIESGVNDSTFQSVYVIDYDVIAGVAVIPLLVGIVVAIVAKGRAVLGRIWYGALFAAVSIMTWFLMKTVILPDTGLMPLMYNSPLAPWQRLAPATFIATGGMLLFIVGDAWGRRWSYSWIRAWLLLVAEAAMIIGVILIASGRTGEGAGTAALGLIGVFGVLVAVTFIVFRQRDIHLRAKFAGLVNIATIFAGFVAVNMLQMIADGAFISQVTIIFVFIGAYVSSLALIGIRPRPLARQ